MSLAMYAAPFDDDYNSYKSSDNNYINNKKKQIHNKTQKDQLKKILINKKYKMFYKRSIILQMMKKKIL